MATRRLLFVHPRREANLAPIYAALLMLVLVSFIAMAVAVWREPPVPAANRVQRGTPPANEPFDSGLRRPRDAPPPPKRSNWM